MGGRDTVLRAWNLASLPSPAYVLHTGLLADNLRVIDRVRREAGVEIIVALKACAFWPAFPLLAGHTDGATASSLAEARLVREEMGCRAHVYAPVYTDEEIDEILNYASHITFNSLSQWERFGSLALRKGVTCGLRVNPELSTVATALYDPCDPQSRLGVKADLASWPDGVEGMHFHALCESSASDLRAVLAAVEERFGRYLAHVKWINMGGGHLMTREGYDVAELIAILRAFRARHPHLRVILEPGSAFTWDTGLLTARVEDIIERGGRGILMLNVSFACHMPDCLEMPYKPQVIGMHDAAAGERAWHLGGNSCLAGDSLGAWAFDDGHEPRVGECIAFRDMIHYTMVKTTMFNGVAHPAFAIHDPATGTRVVRRFDYNDYKRRMG